MSKYERGTAELEKVIEELRADNEMWKQVADNAIESFRKREEYLLQQIRELKGGENT